MTGTPRTASSRGGTRYPYCSSAGPVDISVQGNLTGNGTAPTEEFFHRSVLQLSPGISSMGNMRLELAGCLLLAWALVWLALVRGVKSLGKAVWFTALFPYFILTVLLGFGLTQDGAVDGIRFYLTPDLNRLKDVQVFNTSIHLEKTYQNRVLESISNIVSARARLANYWTDFVCNGAGVGRRCDADFLLPRSLLGLPHHSRLVQQVQQQLAPGRSLRCHRKLSHQVSKSSSF